jgi:DNA ligase-associated metallophosphoesterase
MEIEIKKNIFILLYQKAIYWKQEKTLLISDIHLGKVSHFRKEGIAVPSAALENNFLRLDELLSGNKIDRIIFLGDLFHHKYNPEWDRFADWRQKNSEIEMIIVPGNHDILPEQLYERINVTVKQKKFVIGDFLFTHHPQEIIPAGVHAFWTCSSCFPNVFKRTSTDKAAVLCCG